jgi:hypothetical protein
MKVLVVSTVAVATVSLRAQAGLPACLHYEPDTVRVTGHLSRHMYYGAPGYGEDPRHDEREVGFYLDLPAPICMVPGGDEVDVARRGIRRIQLVLDENGYARLRPLLGKTVTLRGTLSGAITGHHHTPVLLTVATPVRVER